MYDAIIVGARCAGASVGMLLARRGHRVLIVDRAHFPSEIAQGHFIHRHGPRRLHDWGLGARVAGMCPPITATTLDIGDFPLSSDGLIRDGIPLGYAPRRAHLDRLLLEAAIEAGADVRQGWTVDEFVTDDDRVVGVRGRHGDAHSLIEHAKVVVGADGRHSRLAKFVQAAMYECHESLTCWYFSYWDGVEARGLEVYFRGPRVIFAFPTSDGLFGVFIGWRRDELPRVRSDIEREFMAVVDLVPDFSARLRAGTRAERFLGATDVPNFLRRPCGAGWALVGDAGCHKDPLLALGICDAFRDAERLANAIDDGLSGGCPLDDALAAYWRDRDAATLEDYRRNLSAATLASPPAEELRMRAKVRGDGVATRQYFWLRQGSRSD